MGNIQPTRPQGSGLLATPAQLFQAMPLPPQPLNQVSVLLGHGDRVAVGTKAAKPLLVPLVSLAATTRPVSPLNQATKRQQVIVNSGLAEWRKGVRESGGENRGPRINQYARNAKFGPGYKWCGFFAAWNYTQAGFKYPEALASYQKSRDFFLYRSYTSRDAGLHRELDQLRGQQLAQGGLRQYFILKESPTFEYVRDNQKYYGHVDLEAMTHTWQSLPLQPGDLVLFSRGHIGTVLSYDQRTGRLETVEGNASGKGPDGKQRNDAVIRNSYDLSKTSGRKQFDGFGRPAPGDFA